MMPFMCSQQDGSVFAFETKGTPYSISSRRFSLSSSSVSSPSPLLSDSCSTPSSVFWHSRSTTDSLDPSQLDDPSLENAGSIFDDSRLIAILGHESIDTLRELARHPNLTECSQGWHQAFQSKNSEISSGCQLIGGIDMVLGANSENFGEDYWKTINGWPAAFELIVRVLNTMQPQLSHNSSECTGLTPDRRSIAAEKLINRLLDFASDVTGARKTPEKLFCILYMCKAIVDSGPSLRRVLPADCVSKVERVITVLNDSARGILRDFKVLIQNYSSQKVEQDGSILLITRYVMKYIRLLVKHAGSLDPILGSSDLYEGVSLTGHLVRGLISDLDNVVEEKSRLYASQQGLRYIFLMNNAHFVIQEVEHSDIQLILGAEWLKKRRDEFDMYMRDYMSSTWEKATYHLTVATSPPHKRLRPGLLGTFHTNARPRFNSCFKETCDSQMHWKVPCPVLRSRLRESISEHVVEAYQVYLETLNQPSIVSVVDLKSRLSEFFEG